VLERTGEERPRRRDPLELFAVVAEPDDDCARIHGPQRLEQDVDALVVEQLAEVDDRGRVAGEELLEARGIVLVRQPLVRVAPVRRVAAGLRGQTRARLRPPPRAEFVARPPPRGPPDPRPRAPPP